MKIKNKNIEGIATAINEVKTIKPKLPFSAWVALNKNNEAIKPVLEALIQSKQDILSEYGEKDEKGKLLTKTSEKGVTVEIKDMVGYTEKTNSLMEIENEINLEKIDSSAIKEEMQGFDSIFYFIQYLVK